MAIPYTPKGKEVPGAMPTQAEGDLLAMMGSPATEGEPAIEEGGEMSAKDEATAKITQVEAGLSELKAILQNMT